MNRDAAPPSGSGAGAGPVTIPGQNDSAALHVAALAALLAGGLSLGFAGLVPAPVCLLTLILILVMGIVVPRWTPRFSHDSPQRTGLALSVLGLLVAATAGSGPGALFSGQLSGALSTAVAELSLPAGVPIGLLAALAAGALVAVALELAERRGIQSALVLGIAVLGLASVAAPGTHLLPGIVLGWPATMFALTKLAATAAARPEPASAEKRRRGSRSTAGTGTAGTSTPASAPPTLPAVMRRMPLTPAASARLIGRWQLLPMVAAITVSLAVLAAAVLSGVTVLGEQAGGWNRSPGFTGTAGNRSTSDYLGGDMDLSSRGPLGSEPVAEVTASSPRLWRAGVLDEYTGRGWLTTQAPAGLPTLVGDDDDQGSVTVVPAPEPGVGATHTDEVRTVRSGATQVLAPGQLISLTSTSLSTGGSVFVSSGERITLVGQSGRAGRYTVRSQVALTVDEPATVALLAAAGKPTTGKTTDGESADGESADGESADGESADGETADGETKTGKTAGGETKGGASADGSELDDGLDPRWSALPKNVPTRVRQLADSLVTRAPSRLAAVQAVEAELARRMTYVLDSPVPPKGADAVEDVLFVSHSGFCEQFATAEVVLLRSAGVPARMAVGFAGGEAGDDGFRTLLRSDAHAWVEVWFPGVGWVTSDPTPAAAETQTWQQQVQARMKALLADRLTWALAVLALLLLVAVGLLIRRRPARSGAEPEPGRVIDPDLAAAFTRLEAGLLAEGRPRAQNETITALARRLNQPEPDPSSDPGLVQALKVLERALYAPRQPSRQECLTAAAAIDQHGGTSPVRSR